MNSSHRPYLRHDFHDAVRAERAYQNAKWGAANVGGHSVAEWLAILTAELGEVSEEVKSLTWHQGDDPGGVDAQHERLRAELIQVAAVAAAWVEGIDKALPDPDPICPVCRYRLSTHGDGGCASRRCSECGAPVGLCECN